MFANLVKHLAEVRLVLILSVAKHENIIQIHQHKIIDVPMHNRIHGYINDFVLVYLDNVLVFSNT